jgi:di/tricarboxylate transporter
MILVFLLFFLAFLFFLNERRLRVHAALISTALSFSLIAFGYVQGKELYAEFSNTAVVTVVLMLIMTGILERSGVIKIMIHGISRFETLRKQIVLTLFILVVIASAVMNDVGALAIILPGALVLCQRMRIAPATVLMSLSFGALLGGLLTKVGTPPNIIIANFREEVVGVPFSMFAYTPVGIVVCIAGGATILLLRKRVFAEKKYQLLTDMNDHPLYKGYIPLLIPERSPLIGKKIGAARNFNAELVFPRLLLRKSKGKWKCFFKKPWDVNLLQGDVLLIQLSMSQENGQSEFVQEYIAMGTFDTLTDGIQDEICEQLMHVCMVDRKSSLMKNEPVAPAFRERFSMLRLWQDELPEDEYEDYFEGKVLLFLGDRACFNKLLDHYRLIELDEPQVSIEWPRFRRVLLIFATAILLPALGFLRLEVSLGLALLVFLMQREVSWEQVSKSIDVPLVVLIATMLVNAKAFTSTGAAEIIATTLTGLVPQSPILLLWVLTGVTILLTNVVSNAACAAIMAPVGLSLANSIGLSPDAYLMGICVGSSCAFLTPIGHQCNMLVYKAGHYDFSCYFKLGIWVSLVVWISSCLSIPLFWEL